MHLSSNQAFNSSRFLNRSRRVKTRSRSSPTWFSTWPLSQPEPAGALEQSERPIMGVEHRLLCLARIGPHEQHAAVAEPDMGGLHNHRQAIQQNHLVAPVELIGLTWRKAQRDVGRSGRLSALLAPPS